MLFSSEMNYVQPITAQRVEVVLLTTVARCQVFNQTVRYFGHLKNEGRTGQEFVQFVPVNILLFLVTTFCFSRVLLACFLSRTLF